MIVTQNYQTEDNKPYQLSVAFEFNYAGTANTLSQILATFSIVPLIPPQIVSPPLSSPVSPVSPGPPPADETVSIALQGETAINLVLSTGSVKGKSRLQALSTSQGGVFLDVFYGDLTDPGATERIQGIVVVFYWTCPHRLLCRRRDRFEAQLDHILAAHCWSPRHNSSI